MLEPNQLGTNMAARDQHNEFATKAWIYLSRNSKIEH